MFEVLLSALLFGCATVAAGVIGVFVYRLLFSSARKDTQHRKCKGGKYASWRKIYPKKYKSVVQKRKEDLRWRIFDEEV